MAEIQITTTQNVNLNFKAAELNHRILAWFIDVLVKLSYISLMSYLIFKVFKLNLGSNTSDYWSAMAVVIVFSLPLIFYTLASETFLGGQTVGKKVMKLKVLKIDGYQTGFMDFFIRWVMRIVDINLAIPIPGVVGLVTIGSSKKAQRLGGMASGTAVVSLRNKVNISHTILDETVNNDYQPTYPSVIKLSDNDVRIIKENFIKAQKNKDHGLFLKLKEKIVMVIDTEPLEEGKVEEFIDTVIKDYNYYTTKM
ncbi:RDD family protein [Wenyingzhuangia sp. IMCC45533]